MSDLIEPTRTNTPANPIPDFHTVDDIEPESLSTSLLRARDFFYQVILKHKWLILAVLVTAVALSAVQSLSTTPLYRGEMQIQVDPDFANVLPYKSVADSGYVATPEYLETQTKVIQSRALAERVVRRLNLTENSAFHFSPKPGILITIYRQLLSLPKQAIRRLVQVVSNEDPGVGFKSSVSREDKLAIDSSVDRLKGRVNTEIVRNSRFIEIGYVSHDPVLAATVVNAVAEEFIELDFESRYTITTGASDFLRTQLEELRKSVESSEEKLINYARNHNILNYDERENMVLTKLSQLNRELTNIETQLNRERARYQSIQKATPANFPEALKTRSIVALEQRLSELKRQHVNLLTRFDANWPAVTAVEEEIAETQDQLRSETQKAIRESKASYLISLQEYENVRDSLEQQKIRADRVNESLIQYKILEREVATNKEMYNGLLERMKQAGLSATLKSTNIRIIDRAEIPGSPYLPRIAFNLILAVLIGLATGIGLATILHVFDNTIKTPDQIERSLGLPSLGLIPTIHTMKELYPAEQHIVRVDPTPRGDALIPYNDFSSGKWEPYRTLRTSILLSHSDKPPRTILVTSPLADEGKTTTAINLSIVLAQTGAQTLLIDLDMRKPRLAEVFGLNWDMGMSVFLSGNSKQIPKSRTAVPNLYLIIAGKKAPNPAELIGSNRMREALQSFCEFDFVVIDSPPILSCTDALLLSPLVDGVILVTQGGRTPKNALKKARNHLWRAGSKILGVIVNNVDLDKPEYAYYYSDYYPSYP